MSSPNFHSQDNYPQGREKKKTIVDINPWGAENLFTLNLFNEEEYACFMRSLTKAELMVISPLHINIQVIRCRATQIPFSKHGSIAYPLKSPTETKELPWTDFRNLPFIVVYNEGYNPKNNYEAKINLQNIVRARKLMEEKLGHPLFEGGRTRYRLIGQGFCTFSNTQMAKLQDELDIENNNCHVTPHGLRQHEICEYQEKLNHNVPKAQVENWLNSHYPLADAVYTGCVSGKFPNLIDNNKLIFEQFWTCLRKFITQYLNTKTNDLLNQNSKAQADVYKRQINLGDRMVTYEMLFEFLISNELLNDIQDINSNDVRYNLFEEFCILASNFSNDEGSNLFACGAVHEVTGEAPDKIIEKSIQNTALDRRRIEVDRAKKVSEWSPGYLQKALIDVFLTGDADLY